jgi:hypothetical protein
MKIKSLYLRVFVAKSIGHKGTSALKCRDTEKQCTVFFRRFLLIKLTKKQISKYSQASSLRFHSCSRIENHLNQGQRR